MMSSDLRGKTNTMAEVSSTMNENSNSKEKPDPAVPIVRLHSRNVTSKYDFVKVRVWLGDNADHYYVLSRFLLSRMLTVTKIPNHVAIKIALELKKLLIDNSLLDVSQSDLEVNLFKLMEKRGFGEDYICRYKMMTRFHHQRVPLVILVCGTACAGKSTIATQLAQRLNLPNVLQTDMVYELLRTSTDAPLSSTPVWARKFNSPDELITEFCRECRIVRKGLAGDLKKAMKDGKPIIIEGIHLDPSIYLMEDENKASKTESSEIEGPSSVMLNAPEISAAVIENDIFDIEEYIIDTLCFSREFSEDDLNNNTVSPESSDISKINSESKGEVEVVEDLEVEKKHILINKKNGVNPIIVSLVLKMAEFDHKALLEEWLSTRTFSDSPILQDNKKLMKNMKTIQNYLCSFKSQGITVVNTSSTTFPQTLDWLHGHLLQRIEEGIVSPTIDPIISQPSEG